MKSWYRSLFILFTLIFYLQSTTAYPRSRNQAQRNYLLCQFSAVSCKRSLSNTNEIENSLEMNTDEYLQRCIILNNPLRYCLDEILRKEMNFIQQIN